jgi:hypothetical protein
MGHITWSTLRSANSGTPPYNKQVDRTKLARHAACFRKRPAGTGPALLLRRRAGPQALPLTWALYGRGKMKKLVVLVILSVCSVICQEKIGAVYSSKNAGACLLIKHSQVNHGDTLDLLGGNSRRYLGQAVVVGRADSCEESKDDPAYTLYRVQLNKAWFEDEIELVGFLRPMLRGTRDSTELFLHGKKQEFELYQCASSEGVHLFVRQKHDHSKVAWH